MKKLLLHVCCAPCLLTIIDNLKNYQITLYFYNPNIMDFFEYEKRLNEVKKIAGIYNVDLIEGPYENDKFLTKIKIFENEKEGGKRCFICYEMRLEKMKNYGKDFDFFASTLVVSPYKNKDKIDQLGRKMSTKYLFLNLDKKGLKKDKIKKYNIYSQNYCGCIFSKR